MSSIAVSSIAFGCAFGGALVAMLIKRYLPESHLSSESKDQLKLGMGLIASLAALVLGLLIATSKGVYDAQSSAVKELAGKVILLEGVLAKYGPETKEPRALLLSAVTATLHRLWPEDSHQAATLALGEARVALESMYDKLAALDPQNDAQRAIKSRAMDATVDLGAARIRLFSQQESSLPAPLIVVLLFWLTILFVGYGLLAPANATVITMLFVCTLSMSAAIFLMLELATPFTGIMRVSSKPMQDAILLLGK